MHAFQMYSSVCLEQDILSVSYVWLVNPVYIVM